MHSMIYFGFLVLLGVTTVLEVDHQLPVDLKFLHGKTYMASRSSAFNGTLQFNGDANNPLNTNFGFANAMLGVISSYRGIGHSSVRAGTVQPDRVVHPGQLAAQPQAHARPGPPLLSHRPDVYRGAASGGVRARAVERRRGAALRTGVRRGRRDVLGQCASRKKPHNRRGAAGHLHRASRPRHRRSAERHAGVQQRHRVQLVEPPAGTAVRFRVGRGRGRQDGHPRGRRDVLRSRLRRRHGPLAHREPAAHEHLPAELRDRAGVAGDDADADTGRPERVPAQSLCGSENHQLEPERAARPRPSFRGRCRVPSATRALASRPVCS